MDLSYWQLPEWNTVTSVTDEKSEGDRSIRLLTKRPDWSQSIQLTLIYPKDIAKLEFRGSMKTKDVKAGLNDIEMARATVILLNAEGDRIGEYPPSTNRSGSTDWQTFDQTHSLPAGTRAVTIGLGMYLSTGEAWFKTLDVVAYDADGAVVEPKPFQVAEVTDTTGWWPFAPGYEDTSKPLVLDMSRFLDAPAGKHGFVKTDGNYFAFGDGQRARFWGAGAWPGFELSKQQIVAYAERLSRLGINMVRLHGLDAWDPAKSILDENGKLKVGATDVLDFYISEMKKRGIYINMNLLTKRKYLPADNVPGADALSEGGKCAAMYNRHLIDLQKDYARQIFTHKNPYTSLTYAEEPAIAYTEIVNEDNLFDKGMWAATPEVYVKEIQDLYKKWCVDRTLPAPTLSVPKLVEKKDAQVFQFLIEVQKNYYKEMVSFLRDVLHLQIPICGSNAAGGLVADLLVNSDLDFMDRHDYWDHPAGGWTPTSHFRNQAMSANLLKPTNITYHIAVQRVEGKPFTVSEWNFVWSNEYITEGPLIMAAVGGFQGWSTMLQFSISGKNWGSALNGCWENDNKPHWVAPSVAAGLMFLRGDIEPGMLKLNRLNVAEPAEVAGREIPPPDVYKYRIAESLGDGGEKAKEPAGVDESPLSVNDAPGFVVNAAKTQAVVGFFGKKEVSTKDVTFRIANPFAQIIISSLDDQPLSASKQMLITATARAENSGAKYHTFRRGLKSIGHSPILLEPVRGEVTIAAEKSLGAPVVSALDWYGRRTDRTLPVKAMGEGRWNVELGGQPAYWFEVKFSKN